MFSFKECNHKDCHVYISEPLDCCFHHASDEEKEMIMNNIRSHLGGGNTLRDTTLVGGIFEGFDFSDMNIKASNFAFSTFHHCTFDRAKLSTVFFDFCLFYGCSFKETHTRYSVFSGANIRRNNFTDSSIVQSNFMGCDLVDSDFTSCDLYYSNFSMSKIIRTPFEDCNLKRVNFRACALREVSFRYSNPEEAFFKEGELNL